jgi:CheY-like chemotaxis protein
MTPEVPRVLLVEDGATYARLATYLLRSLGYNVTVAETAEEGLQVAAQLQPHIILMDLNLPGMSGHAAVQRIRADPLLREIPTIALTADQVQQQGKADPAQAFTGFEEKPIYEEGFRALMERYLGPDSTLAHP